MKARLFYADVSRVNFTSSGGNDAGDIIQVAGRTGVVVDTVADGVLGSAHIEGIFRVEKAAATVFNIGDEAYWDTDAEKAVPGSAALEGAEVIYLGRVFVAPATNDLEVQVFLNAPPQGPAEQNPVVYEFDCEGGDTDTHILLPATANQNGFLVTGIYGIVTEQFGGGDQDQGVITVEDTDGTDLTTITVADAGADGVGDVRLGYRLDSATAGDAAKIVAAGKGIRAFVSQQTAGASAAGKIKVFVTGIPLI